MNSTSHPVPNLLPRVAPASRPGDQTQRAAHRLGLLAVTVALLAISPQVKAQTTFVGEWKVWHQDPIREYREETTTPPDANDSSIYTEKQQRWIVRLGQSEPILEDYWHVWDVIYPGVVSGTFNDDHWSTALAWSAGLPDINTEARIGTSLVLQLPTTSQGAATAKSLTIFDANNSDNQLTSLAGGTLNLTPLVFNDALRVGVASAGYDPRQSTLTLDGATLTSTGFAKIGVGLPPDAGGELVGTLNLTNNSQWLHPAGLIEIGGGDGRGQLSVDASSLLAGSLLPGAATDPRLVIRPGSYLSAGFASTVRLSELIVDSGHWEAGLLPTGWGAIVNGDLDAGLIHLGESAQGTALLHTNSDARIGQIVIENSSWLELRASASAAAIDIHNGVLYAVTGDLTVGTAGDSGTTTIMTLGRDSGSSGLLGLTGNLPKATVTVHGAVELGRDGHGSMIAHDGTSVTINGDLAIAAYGTGDGELTVSGTVSAQNIQAGTNASDMDYGGSPYSPFPAGMATIRMKGGTLNVTGTSEEVVWPFPNTIHNAGSLKLGSNDLLEGTGTIDFTNPNGGMLLAVGTVAPGLDQTYLDHTGALLIQGDLQLANAQFALTRAFGTLKIDLGGNAAGQFDVLHVTGNADIDGATLEIALVDDYTPPTGATFHFLPVDGLLSGMFASLTDHTGLGLTLADLSLAEGGGLMLTIPVSAIPEVGTILPALGAALAAGWRLRRKWRARQAC